MASIRPTVSDFIDTAETLVDHAPAQRPLTLDEACQIADCVQDVQAALQPDESPSKAPLTPLDLLLWSNTPLRETFIDLPETSAFCDATKDLLRSPTSDETPLTGEERARLQVCTESVTELIVGEVTDTNFLRDPILPTDEEKSLTGLESETSRPSPVVPEGKDS